jgi:hypothetical protein
MLALGEIGVDDVVVQEIRAGARSYGEQLVAGAVDQNSAKSTDFGCDVNWHDAKGSCEWLGTKGGNCN